MGEALKFGTETEVSHEGDVTTKERVEKHNGGETRRLLITEESIRIEDKKSILNKILDAFGKHERGEIVGWAVDASKYTPQTLKTERIVVTTISLVKKGASSGTPKPATV